MDDAQSVSETQGAHIIYYNLFRVGVSFHFSTLPAKAAWKLDLHRQVPVQWGLHIYEGTINQTLNAWSHRYLHAYMFKFRYMPSCSIWLFGVRCAGSTSCQRLNPMLTGWRLWRTFVWWIKLHKFITDCGHFIVGRISTARFWMMGTTEFAALKLWAKQKACLKMISSGPFQKRRWDRYW